MAGELPLDDAFARMDQDIADQVAQAATVGRCPSPGRTHSAPP